MPDSGDNPFRAETQAVIAAAARQLNRASSLGGDERIEALDEFERLNDRAQELLQLGLEWAEGRLEDVVQRLQQMVREEEARQSDVLGTMLALFNLARRPTSRGPAAAREVEALPPAAPAPVHLPRPIQPSPAAPAPAAPGGGRRIVIDDRALDALARVAQSEVGHFGKHGEDELRGALAAVVDTIVNRTANPSFPDTIETVVDQPKQFSAINALGTWTLLEPATSPVFTLVSDHVAARAAGKASEVGGATHFLNPHLSSPSALESWGRFVVDNAVAVFGNDSKKDVHFHGTPPGTPITPPYTLVRDGIESAFDSKGQAQGGAPSSASLRRNIIRICRAELAFFRNGDAKETDDTHFERVGDYWRSIGKAFDGHTVDAEGKRVAWSAAFISFVLKEAGAGDRFPGAAGHCFYFQHFVDRAGPALYRALPASEVAPRPGDIIHHGRGAAANHDFAAARLAFATDDFYPSHSAIVTEVDAANGVLKTIGGNEGDSVRARTVTIDADGFLQPRRSGSNNLPWIGVMKMT